MPASSPRRRASIAPRPTTQARSRQSLEAMLKAAESLLRRKDWREIGIVEICGHAGVTTGAFYARFRAKDDLLPFIYSRYDSALAERFTALVGAARGGQGGDPLRAVIDAGVAAMVAEYRERRWLLRAVALWARQHPDRLAGAMLERRKSLHELPVEALLRFRDRITHADPAHAIRTGLFMVAAAARDKVLFGEAPHASSTPLSDEQLATELARALFAYLTA